MKKRKSSVLFIVLVVSFLMLFACGREASYDELEEGMVVGEMEKDYSPTGTSAGDSFDEAKAPISPDDESSTDIDLSNRKIIRNAEIEIRVDNYLDTLNSIEDIVKSSGGYISDSTSYRDDDGTMSGDVRIRVVPEKLDTLISKLEGLGEVEYKRVSGEDITKEYYDIKARLNSKIEMEGRLVELLQTKTNNVSDLLQVEKELGRVRGDIESMEGTIRYYDDLVGLSTVHISIYEPVSITPSSRDIWGPIKEAFRDFLVILSESVAYLMIFIANLLPWAISGFVVFFIFRVFRRRRKRKVEPEGKGTKNSSRK